MSRRRLYRLAALAILAPLPLLASPKMRGPVFQSPDGASALYAVSDGVEICVHHLPLEEATCWPALGGSVTDLRAVDGGFLAAGYAALDGVTDLFLLRGDGERIEPLPVPEASGPPRGRPVTAVDDGRLVGLVWLEGRRQDRLTLRSARWLGDRWDDALLVAGPGPDSIVAPAVTVLADGRWLLLWTAYDGEDDETLWSLFDGAGWSEPLRLDADNPYPDITPTVVATPTGAVAAWNGFDGSDYRIRTAHFDGERWSEPRARAGRGADDPALCRRDDRLLLSYSTVLPAEWVFVELDDSGRQVRRAVVPSDNAHRPAIRWLPEGVALQWFDHEGEGAVAAWEIDR